MKVNNLIEGGIFNDERGSLRYVNDFSLSKFKRFYLVKNKDVNFIRAWQGHKKEIKVFYPIKGSFVISWVKIDDFENASKNLIAEHCILDSKISGALVVDKRYANGFKAKESNSELLVFSNLSLEESQEDIYRFDSDLWFDWKKELSITQENNF